MPTDSAKFHEEAAAEYEAACDWYLQRSPDAARNSMLKWSALAQIVQAPRRWAVGSHATRRFLLRQFPFILVYRERPAGNIQIVAVAHTSRRPGY